MIEVPRREVEARLARLVGELLADPARPDPAGDLAEATGFGRPHACRLFRQYVGESLPEFVRRLRLERAMHELATADRPIAAIARDGGYGGASTFGRTFRREVGLTPEAFRALARSGQNPLAALPADGRPRWRPGTAGRPDPELARRFACRLRRRDTARVAAAPAPVPAADAAAAAADLVARLRADGIDLRSRRFYRFAEGPTHAPTARWGFSLLAAEAAPEGFLPATIPGGRAVSVAREFDGGELAEAEAWLAARWPDATLAFVEHVGPPRPDAAGLAWGLLEAVAWPPEPPAPLAWGGKGGGVLVALW